MANFTPDPNDALDLAWSDLSSCFGLGGANMITSAVSPQTIDTLKREGLVEKTCALVQAHLNAKLRKDVVPVFWGFFRDDKNSDPDASSDRFYRAVTDLFLQISVLMPLVHKLEDLSFQAGHKCNVFGQTSFVDLFKLMIKGTLHSDLPDDYEPVIRAFYDRAFHVFYVRQERNLNADPDDSSAADDELECAGCRKETDACQCNVIISSFHDVNHKLLEMDVLERLTANVVTDIVHSRIDKHVLETCQGSFTISHINGLENWLDAVVMCWIRLLYTSSANQGVVAANEVTKSSLETFRRRLMNFLYETYTKTRIDQLFNIIIEFPDSQPALEDLKECLGKTDLRSHLTKSLKSVLQKKLLHLGVNTTDILTAYIAAIRALRMLDPSGVVLEIVCEPVRKYLRTRDDTVRCIVQSLIDDNNSELADELKQNEGLFLDESFYEEDDLEGWEMWMPDPIDANPSRKSQSKRTSDIISMLVNIYGSKELFVNEYRSLLSNRLLSQFTYETEKEIRNLELLKLRFGEAPLHQCEVMLKDIGDSKRINGLLHSPQDVSSVSAELKDQPFPINAVILSAQFWPQFKEENLQLPPEVSRSLDVYTKAFEAMKGNRTLVWKNHLGFANIDLEIGDKKINLTVSPVHAAIIHQFQVKAEWTAEDLAHTLKIPVSTLRRRIAFWQTQGLVREMACDRFALIEDCPMRRLSGMGGMGGEMSGLCSIDDEESESITRNAKDQREDELQVFWSYIVNMLINLESLPLERIFQMLKMFAVQASSSSSSGGVDCCDLDEVRQFLDKKVREHELVFVGGQYKLPPKN